MHDARLGMQSVALIGPYPPPYGGISIHVQRLKEYLERKGYGCVVYELRGTARSNTANANRVDHVGIWALRHLVSSSEDVIHAHNSDWRIRVLMGVLAMTGRKTVVSIHGQSLAGALRNAHWFKRWLIAFTLRRVSGVICVNETIADVVVSLGVDSNKVALIPSFIAPEVKQADIDAIPPTVWRFIENHRPIVVANASRLAFYNGFDLYGVDMCVDLCGKLARHYPDLGFVFCLPEIGLGDYFAEIERRIATKGIEGNFLFQTKPCQMYPILMRSDLFVRPTCVDGYGISIAEAIHFGVPAVASDVCTRPEGTVLFESRNCEGFLGVVEDALARNQLHKKRVADIALANGAEATITLYQRLLHIDKGLP